jgi:hypothetical protein
MFARAIFYSHEREREIVGLVQRIDLRPALALLLMADTQREIEQRAKAIFERRVACDLAADVTNGSSLFPDSESRRQGNHEPTKPGVQKRKKTHSHTLLSCKIEYLPSPNPRVQSDASEFFTDDYLASRAAGRTCSDPAPRTLFDLANVRRRFKFVSTQLALPSLWTRALSQTNPEATAILVDEHHTTIFKCCSDLINRFSSPTQQALARLQALNCGNGNARLFSQLVLGPCQQLTRGFNLSY